MLNPHEVLAKLGLTDAEREVYLAMLAGALTAREIVKSTGRSRPTVYYALNALEQRGLLSKTGTDDAARLRVEPLGRLTSIVRAQQFELDQLEAQIGQFRAQFASSPSSDHKSEVAFYEGVSAVQNVIMDSLYNHSRHIDSLVPAQNFFWQLGREFVERYVETRQRLGTRTRNLWATPTDATTMKEFYAQAEVRLMPTGLGDKFRTTMFLYDDKVLYVSSLASGYAVLMHSTEHHELMKALYDVVWGVSKA